MLGDQDDITTIKAQFEGPGRRVVKVVSLGIAVDWRRVFLNYNAKSFRKYEVTIDDVINGSATRVVGVSMIPFAPPTIVDYGIKRPADGR
ncbi:hypothetical protein BH11PSE2_BH11PSE2_05810 [soil metagenome]